MQGGSAAKAGRFVADDADPSECGTEPTTTQTCAETALCPRFELALAGTVCNGHFDTAFNNEVPIVGVTVQECAQLVADADGQCANETSTTVTVTWTTATSTSGTEPSTTRTVT